PFQLSKRTTAFNACPVEGVDPLTVAIIPDPLRSNTPAEFDVSGTLSHDITSGTTILGIGFADEAKNPLGEPYTQTFDQSVKAKSPFSITAKSVPVPELPSSYLIGVVVGDPTDDPKNPIDVYGCAFASVGPGKSLDDFSISALFD
ncbi:9745_t:CDS:1, partial [Dentiscutata heterogama]